MMMVASSSDATSVVRVVHKRHAPPHARAAALDDLIEDDEAENTPTVPSTPGPAFVPPDRGAYRDAREAQIARAEAEIAELKAELAELRERRKKDAEIVVPVTRVPLSTSFTVGIVLLVVGALLQAAALVGRMFFR